MSTRALGASTVAEAVLGCLRQRGIERIYTNGGTDFAPIVEAYARAGEAKLELPEPFIAAHENLAVGMAHGAWLVSRRPQAVMVHVSVGTANAVMGLFNAARDRVPILLMAGRTPVFERDVPGARNGGIHWSQEMFDQASMLREFVKWDYELRDGAHVPDVVDRALSVARSEPSGPVYLTLPREVLARGLPDVEFRDNVVAPATPPSPLPAAMSELADCLDRAEFPVIVTSSTGRDPELVDLLGQICEAHGIGIVENAPRFVNARSDHPLHLGYSVSSVVADADVLCFIDCDVPWIPAHGEPRQDATVAQCGVDPLFARYPMRSQRSDLTIAGSSGEILRALAGALRGRPGPGGRFERIARAAAAGRARRREALAAEATAGGPITKRFMNWALSQVRDDETTVVDEYWASWDALRPRRPGSAFHNPPTGGLGWGLPAALGVQHESPGATVVATVGDGAYIFANPAACHLAMAMYDLPVLTVVCSNNRWGAVEGAARGLYPDGHFARAGRSPLARFTEAPAFERYVEASGGHGESVAERSGLVPALRRGLAVVREERRPALVNVHCAD